MRIRLNAAQEAARGTALAAYEHQLPRVGRLARLRDCLPVYFDWLSFLGLGSEGQCLWVEYDTGSGEVSPAEDIVELSLLMAHLDRVPGLELLRPTRPQGRATCDRCGGAGHFPYEGTRIDCSCGGLGWVATSPEELGIEAS
jgi:hypothetical protein